MAWDRAFLILMDLKDWIVSPIQPILAPFLLSLCDVLRAVKWVYMGSMEMEMELGVEQDGNFLAV